MLKAFALLRTAYLVFVIGYTVRAMPFLTTVAKTFDEQYAICSSSMHLLVRAAWLAIAWIALETVIGWVVATRRRPVSPRGGGREERGTSTSSPTSSPASPAPPSTRR